MNLNSIIEKATGAGKIRKRETIQTLWSGYGHIYRYDLLSGSSTGEKSVVVKHVSYDHNRRAEGLSDTRKRRSYHVETNWYRDWSSLCDEACRVPRCYGLEADDKEVIMVLEDLDASGYDLRKSRVRREDVNACLSWLAHFHGRFMGEPPRGLWETGSYWHLETRPDELALLDDERLRLAAPLIDKKLNSTSYPTLIHGDAKLANFCFSNGPKLRAAAVDFQYTGGGCAMKDLAYLAGSCFFYDQCEEQIPGLLDNYFSLFRSALDHYGNRTNPDKIEEDWRELFPYAWADFHRFLKGWTPGRWSRDDYSERVTRRVVDECLEGQL